MSEVIKNVSDTSFWVAQYRAQESERADALFRDPYAKILVGDRAGQIDTLQSETTKWTRWTVIMRTCIIDQMIRDLVAQGVKTFVNLGAGLDSRPYRMDLAEDIRWVEVDFPHVIEHKARRLAEFKPTCRLERIGIDLADRAARQGLFANLAQQYSPIVVLTEGVLPYLSSEQVSELSEDLLRHPGFKYWIGEYISPKSYPYLKSPRRMRALKNAPFRFFPEDWMGFFKQRGWRLNQEQYYIELSEKYGRPSPLPKIFKLLAKILGEKWAAPFKKMSGFLLWERES